MGLEVMLAFPLSLYSFVFPQIPPVYIGRRQFAKELQFADKNGNLAQSKFAPTARHDDPRLSVVILLGFR